MIVHAGVNVRDLVEVGFINLDFHLWPGGGPDLLTVSDVRSQSGASRCDGASCGRSPRIRI